MLVKISCNLGYTIQPFRKGSGYFAVNGILPLETILPQSFTCAYIAISARFQPVTLWCNGSCTGLEIPWMQVQISAGRALKERAVYTVGPGSVCKCTGQCTLEGTVQGGECTLGVQNFFICF